MAACSPGLDKAASRASAPEMHVRAEDPETSPSQVFAEMAKGFVLLMYRVEGANALTMDDMAEMHPDILEGLAKLYDEEESKSTERLVDEHKVEVTEVEETAGK